MSAELSLAGLAAAIAYSDDARGVFFSEQLYSYIHVRATNCKQVSPRERSKSSSSSSSKEANTCMLEYVQTCVKKTA